MAAVSYHGPVVSWLTWTVRKSGNCQGHERLESALTRGRSSASHMLAKLYMRKSLLLERDTILLHKRKNKSGHW